MRIARNRRIRGVLTRLPVVVLFPRPTSFDLGLCMQRPPRPARSLGQSIVALSCMPVPSPIWIVEHWNTRLALM
jgi:hypothetical protein